MKDNYTEAFDKIAGNRTGHKPAEEQLPEAKPKKGVNPFAKKNGDDKKANGNGDDKKNGDGDDDKKAKGKKKPPFAKKESDLGAHVFEHVLSEKIGEYRSNIIVHVPSRDTYRGVSGFGTSADAAKEDAFRAAGHKYGTFTHVTFSEYYALPKDVKAAITDDWEAFREQVVQEADIPNYIVYTQHAKGKWFEPAVVTQDLRHAKFVAQNMKDVGYEQVVTVESPAIGPGLSAPKLRDPAKKFKVVSDTLSGKDKRDYEGAASTGGSIRIGEQAVCKGDPRYLTEDERQRLTEQPAPKIKVKHPGILGVGEGEFMKKDSKYFVGLAKKKGAGPIQKALLNLERWNKNDDPKISKRARKHIDAIKKELGGK